MKKELNLFLLLLLLSYISSTQPKFYAGENQAIKFEIGSTVEFGMDRNYFQFDYSGPTDETIYFSVLNHRPEIYITAPGADKIRLERNRRYYSNYRTYEAKLNTTGTYYISVECEAIDCLFGGNFASFIQGRTIDIIDLTKNYYFNDIDFMTNTNNSVNTYKVNKLSEEKYVYFTLLRDYLEGYGYYYGYYPYYPDEPDPYASYYYPFNPEYHRNQTIFEVCNYQTNQCQRNVKLYHFKKEVEYIIKIHYLRYYYHFYNYGENYLSSQYIFFPITKENFKQINSDDSGILLVDRPTFYIANNNLKKIKYLFGSELSTNSLIFYSAKANEAIDYNNIAKISNLEFKGSKQAYFDPDSDYYQINLIYSLYLDSQTKVFLIDETLSNNVTYNIPANSAAFIYNYEEEEEKSGKYYISTLNCDKKKMKLALSEENELTDTIIQNYYPFIIYADKDGSEYKINVKKYALRYAIFGAVDPYYYKSFYNTGAKYLKQQTGIDIVNYLKLSQANFRLNSYYIPFYEFYNLYLNGIDAKVNIYIRQLYGGTELYECDTDGVNIKNLDKLTTPISNAKCKNRKSLINRLFNFNGEKIITGYITPDSYFDIYAEIDKDTNSIDINPLLISKLNIYSTAKYLRKGVEYKMNFPANHLIKLEPGYNAHITITNGQTSSSIDPEHPTTKVAGDGFTIKSDNYAMVYFFGRLPSSGVKQVKIENKENHYVIITNVEKELIVDFGFENYFPSTYPFDSRVINGTLYMDNLYNKLKTKLVTGEFLYIYYLSDTNPNLQVKYIQNNLNIKNDDFKIFYMPKNDDNNSAENTIVINAYEYQIIHNIKFCAPNTNINLYLEGRYKEKYSITNEDSFNLTLYRGSNKLSFKANQPFIYYYSIYDIIDDGMIKKNTDWSNERVIYNDLKITEVKDEGGNNNKMSITFKPNYKKSSTRYIIIVGLKNNDNTIDSFNDPCYISQLLNTRPEGVKVFKIYDIGDKETITASVDISSITDLNKEQEFIVNIVSQELRFGKKINFYTPYKFGHTGKEKSQDDEDPYNDFPPPSTPGEKSDGKPDSSTSLVLAIVLPIVGVIIIIGVALLVINYKRRSSSVTKEEIEKLV